MLLECCGHTTNGAPDDSIQCTILLKLAMATFEQLLCCCLVFYFALGFAVEF